MKSFLSFFGDCQNPRVVHNRYNGMPIVSRCGYCPACLNRKRDLQKTMCVNEAAEHLYTFFVTLTYSNEFVPRLYFRKIDINRYCVYSADNSVHDFVSYPDEKLPCLLARAGLNGAISYTRKSDIQKFLKRVRVTANRRLSRYEKIRYYLVSEYGPKSLRVHWHLLLFVDSPLLAQILPEIVASCWKLGRYDCQLSRGQAAGYVAGYINSISKLPRIYKQAAALQPTQSHSTYMGFQYLQDIKKEIYESPLAFADGFCSFQLVGNGKRFLSSQDKRTLFPKCRGFNTETPLSSRRIYCVLPRVREAFGDSLSLADYTNLLVDSSCYPSLPTRCISIRKFFQKLCGYDDVSINNPDEYSRALSAVYSVLLTSKHFLSFVCDNDFSLIDSRIKMIYDYYNYCDYQRLISQYKLFEDSSNDKILQSLLSTDYQSVLDSIFINSDGFAQSYKLNPFYAFAMRKALAINNENIKHKELNDTLKILE